MKHIIVKYGGLLLLSDVCKGEIITIVRKSLTCFTNIIYIYIYIYILRVIHIIFFYH